MKKLSEIKDDEIIFVDTGDGYTMTKLDYMLQRNSDNLFEDNDIFTTKKFISRFSWEDVVSIYADEHNEEWDNYVLTDIGFDEELAVAANIMNSIFRSSPTYYQDERIEIDE